MPTSARGGAGLRVRGGEFRITAADNSPENIYIQRITLNGEAYPSAVKVVS